jgi:hypothetical protein
VAPCTLAGPVRCRHSRWLHLPWPLAAGCPQYLNTLYTPAGLWEEAVLAFAGRVVPQPSQLTATLLCAAASLAQQWGLVAGVTASSESAAVTASDPTARHLQILSYVTLTLQSALQHVTLSLSWHASLFTAAGEGASITDAVAGVEPNSTSVTLKWMCEKVVMPGLSMHQPASIRCVS